MSYLYRCRHVNCRQRRALPKLLEDYIRIPKCKGCGRESLRRDLYQEKRNKRLTCNCDGSHHPHQKGSIVWCVDSKVKPTDEDYEDRYNTIRF